MSCSLDCYCKSSLMFCTVSCDSSRKNFSSFRNIFLLFCYILVIDLVIFFSTEYADFFSSASRTSSLKSAFRSASLFVSHDDSPFLIERQLLINTIRDIHKSVSCRSARRRTRCRLLIHTSVGFALALLSANSCSSTITSVVYTFIPSLFV